MTSDPAATGSRVSAAESSERGPRVRSSLAFADITCGSGRTFACESPGVPAEARIARVHAAVGVDGRPLVAGLCLSSACIVCSTCERRLRSTGIELGWIIALDRWWWALRGVVTWEVA